MNESTLDKNPALSGNKVQVSLSLSTLDEIRGFCGVLAKTDMVPKAYLGKPDNILVAILQGQELGLPPLQSLQSIAVINGLPTIYGDAGLSLVRRSGLLQDFDEYFELDGVRFEGPVDWFAQFEAKRNVAAVCVAQRAGSARPRKTYFSIRDAVTAGLWGKTSNSGIPSPWVTNPGRMMMFRARGFNLRDEFGDILKGLRFFEEAQDMEPQPDGSYAPAAAPAPDTAPAPAPKAGGLSTLLSSKLAEAQRKTIVVNPAMAPATPPIEPEVKASPDQAAKAQEIAPASSQSDLTTGQDEALPTGSEAKAVGGDISLADEALANDLIVTLEATAKGRALLAGVRKAVKLTNPAQRTPDDLTRFKLFLEELVVAKSKL